MRYLTICIALACATPVAAKDITVDDEGGTLNPQDSGFGRVFRNIDNGIADMTTCATGYYVTKSGRHALARRLFEACAEAGYTGAMTWMSQLDNNGLGGDYNPDAAADWDRRAAEAGDPVGQFNYGLDLMRGHGVTQDMAQGRALVDQAARQGLDIARRLQGADYDLDEVTPDADNWKYAPLF
ncbi:sel1 repeat family protein [Epibacterium sp. SM1979]|uniref:Sel1 repeat family protein n=1 Tax=Tritonibacter litoralis TaxID=2662264 RepID=A0A843YD06_9RHOB|nr:sel1 repeat family protein [Tritonibacter litoralis]MQQ08811.1 sel1 repeat family protein [Tritonibacter litoralis]